MTNEIIDLTDKNLLEVVEIVREKNLGNGTMTDVTHLYGDHSLYTDPMMIRIGRENNFGEVVVTKVNNNYFQDKVKKVTCVWLDSEKCKDIAFLLCNDGVPIKAKEGYDLHFLEGSKTSTWAVMRTLGLVLPNTK